MICAPRCPVARAALWLALALLAGVPAGAAALPLAFSGAAASLRPVAVERDLVLIDAGEHDTLAALGLPVIWKGASFFLAEWDQAQRDLARRAALRFEVLAPQLGADRELYLFELHEGEEPPAAWAPHMLFRRGVKVVVAMDAAAVEGWEETGYHSVRIERLARGWEQPAPRAFDCSTNPVVEELLSRTDQSRWTDWLEKISGAEPVEVGGVTAPILSRHSTRLFSGHAHARGFDFLQQQAQSWHYGTGLSTIEIDPYAPVALSAEGATWNNFVLTIPGQSVPADLVLATAHFDSRAVTIAEGQALSPGADDNGSGSAMLLEAARVLRQFRFMRTIKLVWFTGEEQSLLGSAAYVADHPMSPILGVVNVDMASYDGNGDRCFEIHVGTLPQSDSIGQCFALSADQYSPTLNYDYLTTTATDRSDHASFWNGNPAVGAIEISENFFSSSSAGGCVGVDANPNYHRTTDTVGTMMPSFGFDIARTALATVAALAGPIEACFAGAPALGINPGSSVVDLSWSPVAGASAYRISRSTGGCSGQWTEVASVAGTSWSDALASDPVSYAYHVEAVAADGFCVSRPSNCAAATPTVIRARATGAVVNDVCASGGPGSGNGIVDPGETATLELSLLNEGNTALTSIAGTLSTTTPGVSVDDDAASWPDLAPAQSAASLPDHLTLHVDPSTACGTALDLTLGLGYTQGTNTTALPAHLGGTTPVYLIDESFSTGIPPSWTVIDGGSGGGAAATWTTANPGARSIGAPFAAPFAIVDSGNAGSAATQNEQLLTPVVNATGCRQVDLIFNNQFNYDNGTPYEYCDVDVSTNGGSSWTNVLRMQAEGNGMTTPNTKTIDLTSLVAAEPSSLRVRFHAYQSQNDLWWAIDNVRIVCAQPVCDVCLAPAGPPGEPGLSSPLRVSRSAGDLVFDWGAAPAGCGTSEYALYRGDLTTLPVSGYSHGTALACAHAASSLSIAETDPRIGTADYYLVVAGNGSDEGSYGRDTLGAERPPSAAACIAGQDLAACP